MKSRYSLLLALPLAFGACAAEDDADLAEDTTLDAPETMAPAPAPANMGAMATTVTLAAVGGSAVSGEATLTPAGAQSEVSVTLTGLEAGSTHPGHIHQGTCAAPGSVVAPLSEITADASGSGTMTTTVDVSADAATAGNHLIQYHGAGGAPIACGELMHTM